MKTLSEFNKKAWYRTIKVIYIMIFIFIIAFWIGSIYEIKINNDQYKIINELKYDIEKGANIEEIKISYPELQNNLKLINELYYDISNWAKVNEIKKSYPELNLKPINSSIKNTILLIVSYILVTYLLFFQIINRVFYYIVLWKLVPKK